MLSTCFIADPIELNPFDCQAVPKEATKNSCVPPATRHPEHINFPQWWCERQVAYPEAAVTKSKRSEKVPLMDINLR